MRKNKFQRNCFLLLSVFFNINLIICTEPVNSFIPYTYSPDKEILKKTSMGIGFTASEYIKYGQIKEAIELSRLAVSLNPKEVKLWQILSRAQLNNQLYKEALISIEKAKEINPNISSIWYTKASIEMQIGEINSAIKSINKTLKIDNANSNAYFLLGNARLMQKKHIAALHAFQKATDINPQLWQAMNNRGLIFFELGNKKKAIKIWRRVLTINDDAEPKLALAIALYSLEPNNTESLRLTKEALQENPNYLYQQHQEDQLWGKKLQLAGQTLFKNPKLKTIIKKAEANSTLQIKKEK